MRPFSTLLALGALAACDLGHAPADASSPADAADVVVTPETVTPVTGCAWSAGSWELVDCQGASFPIEVLVGTACTVQVLSTSPVFSGAFGQVQDAAMSLILPSLGTQCQGAYDGAILRGACGTAGGPCAFAAKPVRRSP